MPLIPCPYRFSAKALLTEDHQQHIFKAAHCTARCRLGLLAVDATGQEYFICRQDQLATITVQ